MLLIRLLLLAVLTSGCSMSKKRFASGLPPMTDREQALAEELRRDLHHLSVTIGERNYLHRKKLEESAAWIESELKQTGLSVRRHTYTASNQQFSNIEAELPGSTHPHEIVIIGGHYDSVHDCPAANDNGTGVVATLALARAFAKRHPRPARTIRFLAFVNEEPPFFQTDSMGSLVYARAAKAKGENITAMLSLETMGYFRDEKGSQKYPFPLSLLYPSTGDFIAFVGNFNSRMLVHRVKATFEDHASIPAQHGTGPESIQGLGWSDHWSFWRCGYQALMVTDTAPFRYPYYHTPEDTIDKIDFPRLARVVAGLEKVVEDLANSP